MDRVSFIFAAVFLLSAMANAATESDYRRPVSRYRRHPTPYTYPHPTPRPSPQPVSRPQPPRPRRRPRPQPQPQPQPTVPVTPVMPVGELALKARAVLERSCFPCHGSPAHRAEAGFDYVVDRDALIANRKIVIGQPETSEIILRMTDAKYPMPPSSVLKNRPSPAEIQLVRDWIKSGAPAWKNAPAPGQLVSEFDVLRAVSADLARQPTTTRNYARYFSLMHLKNQPLGGLAPDNARAALIKLVNFLSRRKDIVVPLPIDPDHLIYRITDIRALSWDAATWTAIKQLDPYFAIRNPGTLGDAQQKTVRADWFIARASRGTLYSRILMLPATERILEQQLRVGGQPARAGFSVSGTEANNRIVERREQYGALPIWRSFNFDMNTDRGNIFQYPLGPEGNNAFVHADSDFIVGLPNGLHAYLTVNRNGQKLDEVNKNTGLKCLTCHFAGYVKVEDQILGSVIARPGVFTQTELKAIRALYRPATEMAALLDRDNAPFMKAVAAMSLPLGSLPGGQQMASVTGEPINVVTAYYDAAMPLEEAAAETSVAPDELMNRVREAADLSREFGSLLLDNRRGKIRRDLFEVGYALLREQDRQRELGG